MTWLPLWIQPGHHRVSRTIEHQALLWVVPGITLAAGTRGVLKILPSADARPSSNSFHCRAHPGFGSSLMAFRPTPRDRRDRPGVLGP
jgi:hypothetical protein